MGGHGEAEPLGTPRRGADVRAVVDFFAPLGTPRLARRRTGTAPVLRRWNKKYFRLTPRALRWLTQDGEGGDGLADAGQAAERRPRTRRSARHGRGEARRPAAAAAERARARARAHAAGSPAATTPQSPMMMSPEVSPPREPQASTALMTLYFRGPARTVCLLLRNGRTGTGRTASRWCLGPRWPWTDARPLVGERVLVRERAAVDGTAARALSLVKSPPWHCDDVKQDEKRLRKAVSDRAEPFDIEIRSVEKTRSFFRVPQWK